MNKTLTNHYKIPDGLFSLLVNEKKILNTILYFIYIKKKLHTTTMVQNYVLENYIVVTYVTTYTHSKKKQFPIRAPDVKKIMIIHCVTGI